MSTNLPSQPTSEIAHLMDRLMRRIHAGLNGSPREFDRHNVGPGGGILLLTLAEIAPAPIHTLVTEMARDKSQITRSVKVMEQKGLIERKPSDADGRVILLSLTPEGLNTVEALQDEVARVIDEVLQPLGPSERDLLRDLLRRL